ncbi:MAG: hypothetical protein KAG20_06440 [Cocleimonas sp.]|nr:hypothetical protein [Cocleimonas sp.]
MSNIIYIEIETAIRQDHSWTPQVGQKSLQTIAVDLKNKTVTQKFSTGKTSIGFGVNLKSVRNDFKIISSQFQGDGAVLFSVSGQTATGIHVMPNINYQFRFSISSKIGHLTGQHDGYPSYNVAVNGNTVYDYKQGHVGQLLGSGDTVLPMTRFSIRNR